jgi:uncharacterized protein involved in exopolysaccharide biosynthesis
MAQAAAGIANRKVLRPQEILGLLWRHRIIIAITSAVGAVLAGGIASLIPPQYEATTILSPVSGSSSSGQLGALGSLAAQFGGLGALSGLTAADGKKAESVATLQSEELTERYISDNKLLPVLYSSKWNGATKSWTTSDSKSVPTLWKANLLFKRHLRTVTTDTRTNLVTLTITWKDPHLAADWANGLVKLTNEYLRDKAISASERNIDYLNSQAAKTDAVGVKQAIYTIMESEINKVMLARGDEEYALKIVDPAFAPEKSSSLSVIAWAVIGLISALAVAVATVLLRKRMSINETVDELSE